MDKQQVEAILKTVHYPGFSRDIVSFGMVESIRVEPDSVTVVLKITTQDAEKRTAVVNEVKRLLEETKAFKTVAVHLAPGSTPAPAGVVPSATMAGVQHVIAIASGKGGVGKSTVAGNLALALKELNYSVGLLDLDIYGPSLPILFGINRQPQLSDNRKLIPLDRYGIKVMSFGFISGNETPVVWRGPLVARMTEQFFNDVVWGDLDYMVLDLPPGTGDVQLTLTQKLKMDGAIIVTTPQDIALADVRKGADMFRKVQTPVLGVIENMSGLLLEGKLAGASDNVKIEIQGEKIPVDKKGHFSYRMDLFKRGGGKQESERLGVPLLGEIPISQEIMLATDAGQPIVIKNPDSPLTAIYKGIARRIVADVEK
jgi:ATP-binding protein involved in chromosome partitioning